MAIIKIEGKPLEKLIETVSNGIGILYEPKRIIKKADSEAYRIEKLEEAKAKGLILRADAEMEIIERAKERFAHKEINRQINLESIVEKSAKHLGETVSEQPIDDDWRTRFFNKAQDVTNEEMQEIWGKILAEEITQPGKIGFKTLEIISNITKMEANLFETACKIAFKQGMILKFNTESSFEKYGLSFASLLILRAAGLIYESNDLTITFDSIDHIGGILLEYGNNVLLCKKENTQKFKFNQIKFTPAGAELMSILSTQKNMYFLEEFIAEKKKENLEISFYAKF